MNPSKIPILSIGIPTFNRHLRLKELLQSIVDQQNIVTEEVEVFVSDNSPGEEAKSIVSSFNGKIQNLRYHKNSKNIGADANILQLFKMSRGEYVWIMPDDDLFATPQSVKNVVDKIQSTKVQLTYLNLNSRIIQFDSNEIIQQSVYSFHGDIIFMNGKDILNVLTDIDLLAANRLVIKRNAIKLEFSEPYCQGSLLSPLALSLAACSSGPALVTSDVMTLYREGSVLEWRKNWFKLLLQDMTGIMLDAVRKLKYSQDVVNNIVERRKVLGFKIITPHYLIFQLNGLSWRVLSQYYGKFYVFKQVMVKIFYALPKKGFKKIIPSKIKILSKRLS